MPDNNGPCLHCSGCEGFESDSDSSETDRNRVPCKNCYCKRKDHDKTDPKTRKKKPGVKNLFDGITAKKDPKEMKDMLLSANKEAVDGLKSKNKKTAGKKEKAAQPKDEPPVYRLKEIYMNINGTRVETDPDGNKILVPRVKEPPTRRDVVEAVQKGHAVQSRTGIALPIDGSFEDFNSILEELLPKPFQYFKDTWDKTCPPYVFATIEGRPRAEMRLYQNVVTPSVAEVEAISVGPAGKGFASNKLYLVTRRRIPADVVAGWSTNSIIDDHDTTEDDLPDSEETENKKASASAGTKE
ncbi:hypothetical protein V5O48_019223, partial [Marasmius crinis-equi]